jgi:hypothetical protein
VSTTERHELLVACHAAIREQDDAGVKVAGTRELQEVAHVARDDDPVMTRGS